MAPITAAELAAVCRAAEPESVAGFAADLYEARGRTVERTPQDGAADAGTGASFALVVADGRQRVAVPDGGTVPGDAEVVVAAGRRIESPAGRRVVDAGSLRDALCYAVDRETADRLLERWFDRSLSSIEGSAEGGAGGAVTPGEPIDDATATPPSRDGTGRPAPPDDGRDGDGSESGTAASRRPAAFAVGALVVLVAAAGVVGLAVGLSPGFGPANATGTPTVASSSTATPVGTGQFETTGPATPRGFDTARAPGPERTASARLTQLPNFMSPLPPGVTRDGIADYRRLVEANREQLAGNSYRVSFVYRELVDGTTTGVSTQIVRVENGTHYRASTMEFGQFESFSPRLLDSDVYADGTTRYERTADGVRRVPVTRSDPFLERLSQYLGWYLSVEESWIAGRETGRTTTTLRLASDGDPYPGVTNATGDAIVTEAGLVRVLRREYDDPDSGVHVVVTIRVSDVGGTVVTRPPWVPDPDSDLYSDSDPAPSG